MCFSRKLFISILGISSLYSFFGCGDLTFFGEKGSRPLQSATKTCTQNFEQHWCSRNEIIDSPIYQVCIGTKFIKGKKVKSILLDSKGSNITQCLVATNESKNIQDQDCDFSIETKYGRSTTSKTTKSIKECINDDGKVIEVSGKDFNNEDFFANLN